MGELNNFLFFYIIFVLICKFSLQQIIIPLNPINEDNGPTIMTRETFTVQGNDGTPIRVTRIGIHRNNKNLNGDAGDKQTPLELMRLMDDRINSIFEEIISQRIGLKFIFNDLMNNNEMNNNEKEEEKEKENEENKPKDEEKNKENIDEKDFELDEEKKNEEKENKDKNDEEYTEQNKTEEINNIF